MRTIRIGSGAGFSHDRVEPGIELLEKGNLDYFCLECLAERTIAIAQKEKTSDPDIGYNPYLVYRMKRILPAAVKNKVKVFPKSRGQDRGDCQKLRHYRGEDRRRTGR